LWSQSEQSLFGSLKTPSGDIRDMQVLAELAPLRRVGHGLLLTALAIGAAGAQSVKLGVNRTGIHRVTGADLSAAGVRLEEVAPGKIALSCQGEPVACRVTGIEEGRFGEESSVVFYGEGLSTRFTDTNVYWLSWEGEVGPRMAELEFGGATTQVADAHIATVRFEENRLFGMLYSEFLPRDDSLDPWFWVVARPDGAAELPLGLPPLSPTAQTVTVRTAVRGRTSSLEHDPDHHVRVNVSGTPLGEATFDGQAEAIIEGEADTASFRAGAATLRIEVVGDTAAGDRDQVYLDWVECTYARTFAATDGRLTFRLEAGPSRRIPVQGLADGTAEVYQISDARAPQYAAAGAVEAGGVSLCLGGDRPQSYVVTTPAAYLQPAYVHVARPSALRRVGQGADLIIIAHDELVEAVQPLAEYRANQGLRVRTVAVSEIYDAFSHGVFTPYAIRDSLAYAYGEWQAPAPAFVLLVGDASYDYRGYLGTDAPCQVPAYEVPVAGSIPTATDHFFVCVDGDDHVPDLSIGRLPAATPEEVRAAVAKIIAYEAAPAGDWQRQALFVADHEGEADTPGRYEAACESVVRVAAEHGFRAELVALRQVDPALPGDERTKLVRTQLTPRIAHAFAAGAALVEFQGHGNEGFWSRQKVLTLQDVGTLGPAAALPFCLDISCFTGWFDKPDLPGGHSLAEMLVLAPGAGAVACIAPSRLGGLNLDAQLIPRLLGGGDKPLGEVLREARRPFIATQGSGEWDVVENYNLLGDPVLRLRLVSTPRVAEVERPRPRPSAPTEVPPVTDSGDRPALEMGFALGTRAIDPSRPGGTVVLPGGRVDIRQADKYVPGSLKRFGDLPLLFVAKVAFRGKPNPMRTATQGPEGETRESAPAPAPPWTLAGEDLAPLTAAGARVIRQVPFGGVIVSLTPAQADQVAALPEVVWLGRLAPRLKIAPALMAQALVFHGQSTVLIEHVGPECLDGLLADLEREKGSVVDSGTLPPNSVLVRGPSGLIAALANDERVVAVVEPPTAPQSAAQKEPDR